MDTQQKAEKASERRRCRKMQEGLVNPSGRDTGEERGPCIYGEDLRAEKGESWGDFTGGRKEWGPRGAASRVGGSVAGGGDSGHGDSTRPAASRRPRGTATRGDPGGARPRGREVHR
ncbi:hypothetical protein NL676_000330 [Syzygium grande]|nr:hypothetical protein NL676_000330 [Syzygium grande]